MLDGIVEGLENLGIGGWVLAVGAVVVVGPVVARVLRPAAKGAIKTYLAASDRVKSAGEEARESLQELVGDAKSEYQATVTRSA